jgi:hypothetical protein
MFINAVCGERRAICFFFSETIATYFFFFFFFFFFSPLLWERSAISERTLASRSETPSLSAVSNRDGNGVVISQDGPQRHYDTSPVTSRSDSPVIRARRTVRDLKDFFARLAPEDQRLYRYTVEGPDDMPAHIRTALTQAHLAIPAHEGRMALGEPEQGLWCGPGGPAHA